MCPGVIDVFLVFSCLLSCSVALSFPCLSLCILGSTSSHQLDSNTELNSRHIFIKYWLSIIHNNDGESLVPTSFGALRLLHQGEDFSAVWCWTSWCSVEPYNHRYRKGYIDGIFSLSMSKVLSISKISNFIDMGNM